MKVKYYMHETAEEDLIRFKIEIYKYVARNLVSKKDNNGKQINIRA